MRTKITLPLYCKIAFLLLCGVMLANLNLVSAQNKRNQDAQLILNQYLNNGIILSANELQKAAGIFDEQSNLQNQNSPDFALNKANQWVLQVVAMQHHKYFNNIEGSYDFRTFSTRIENLLLSNPNLDVLHHALGICYMEMGDLLQAIAEFNLALRKNPNQISNYIAIGKSYLIQRASDKAFIHFQKANQINPNAASFNSILAGATSIQQAKKTIEIFFKSILDSKQNEMEKYVRSQIEQGAGSGFYYVMGMLYENGVGGVTLNLQEATKWYNYALQMGFSLASEQLKAIYSDRNIYSEAAARLEIDRVIRQTEQTAIALPLPCRKNNGGYQFVDIFVSDILPSGQPLQYESNRVSECLKMAIVDNALLQLNHLHKTSLAENKSFVSLCQSLDLSTNNQDDSNGIGSSNNYEELAIKAAEKGQMDIFEYELNKAMILNYSVDLANVEASKAVLLARIKQEKGNAAPYYYGMGYLLENSGDKDVMLANQWYQYAFQTGYKPAYWKLTNYYKTVSTSRMRLLKENLDKGSQSIVLSCIMSDGSTMPCVIYLIDAPTNIYNPLEQENKRLQSVLNANIPTSTINAFAKLYQLSLQNSVSFKALYVLANKLIEEKKQAQTDLEFQAMQALLAK
jgi:tetratricopeptide (TPR) repeat protein